MNDLKDFCGWSFFVDTGGTFTDCLGLSPNMEWFRAKVLSRGSIPAEVLEQIDAKTLKISKTENLPKHFVNGFTVHISGLNHFSSKALNWDPAKNELTLENPLPSGINLPSAIELVSGWEAPILGMRLILSRNGENWMNGKAEMRLATTRCTNALLEEKGTAPVLFTTVGFGDLLEIGDQRRTELFDLVPRKRKNLAGQVVEVQERVDRYGKILVSPDYEKISEIAAQLVERGNKSAVVSFLHAAKNTEHETQVAKVLSDAGFQKVIISSSISNFPKWLPRLESAVVEAYLSDVLDQYLDRVDDSLSREPGLWVMGSSGGLQKRKSYRAIDSLLSGPAAGVVGAGAIARSSGINNFINLDMGGTSTDVSRYSGSYSYQSPHQVGDARISSVSLKIETVAAGGGSICRIDNKLLRVGPESAGAYPGPACYGFGGPFCLTDVNLLLGRLSIRHFSTPVFVDAAQKKLDELVLETGRTQDDLLQGFLTVANDAMSNAIRKISIEEGYDPSNHDLVAFGGAGGQHACGVAELLGMNRILLPADSGLLSAYGLSRARVQRLIESPVMEPLEVADIFKIEEKMILSGKAEFSQMGEEGEVMEKRAFIRMVGQDSPLEIIYQKPDSLASGYQEKFENIFGYYPEKADLELYSIRILLAGPDQEFEDEKFLSPEELTQVNVDKELERSNILLGQVIHGPLLVTDPFSTLWVADGWSVQKGSKGSLLLESVGKQNNLKGEMPALARRELFSSRFLCLAEEMSAQLERTALSTNVRERLDFSCALLDRKGYLVANAPNIPVHLGAMGVFARSLLQEFPNLSKGDILLSNHPDFGGSHLPDVSLIAPVFGEEENPVCFLANRAHHAEMGGVTPGSMPAGSTMLSEEGVVLYPQYLFKKGISQINRVADFLVSAKYPSRQVDENLADLSAQVASLRHGIEAMEKLLENYGLDEISSQMDALRQESRTSCQKFLDEIGEIELSGKHLLDDGDQICLKVRIKAGRAVFDFSGTSASRRDNLNATEAIVYSVVCYCLRVLIDSNLPLNEGLLDPVEIFIPSGSLLRPSFGTDSDDSPGVAGGNVEISQRLVDLILSSIFQEVAMSQGTMNNVTFGNSNFSHYETLCGGSGARMGSCGTSAVQVHMTNTAITDPEVLESRFPVRLLAFRIRKGSGGRGTWKGGDGIERKYLFEEKTQVSLLTQSRVQEPQGISGGAPGRCGEQILIRKNGEMLKLKSLQQIIADRGDCLIIYTPGGGGFGEPELFTHPH